MYTSVKLEGKDDETKTWYILGSLNGQVGNRVQNGESQSTLHSITKVKEIPKGNKFCDTWT